MRRKVTLQNTTAATVEKSSGVWTLYGIKVIRRDKAGHITHASHGAFSYPREKFPSFKDAMADFKSKQGQHGWAPVKVVAPNRMVIWKQRGN